MKSTSNCIVCDKKLAGKQRSFCSIACKNDYYLNYEAIKSRGLERKSRLVTTLGGKCGRCGYDESMEALSFYDIYGGSLHIDINQLANSKYDRLASKVEGAQVLCRNCVEEIQNPQSCHSEAEPKNLGLDPCLNERIHPFGQASSAQDDEEEITSSHAPRDDGGEKVSSRAKPRDLGKVLRRFLHSLRSVEMTGDEGSVEVTGNGGSIAATADNSSFEMTKESSKIVLGVSGGIDSIVMLDLFAQNYPRKKLVVAHLNHGFREESSDDERFVREIARSYGLDYVTKNIGPSESGNLEEYFRDERRKFLLAAANDNKASLIALGHNADDQAETVLMNLVRGSGPAGLSGMQVHENRIIRPLLETSRAEIESYAREHRLAWQEDETNTDQHYSRNYIRKQILPLLSRLNPEYLSNIGRSAEIQQDLNNYVWNEAAEILTSARMTNAEDCRASLAMTVGIGMLSKVSKPVLYEVFGQMYENAKGSRSNLGRDHLQAIFELTEDISGTKTIDLPDGYVATRKYDKLEITRKKVDNVVSPISGIDLKIGNQNYTDFEIDISISSIRTSSPFELLLEKDSLQYLQVRNTLPGDTIDKHGIESKKKLQDLFVDAKIDRDRRKRWPIFVDTRSGAVIWVPGLAIEKNMVPNQGNLRIKVSEDIHEK